MNIESVHRGTFVPEANASLLLTSTYPPSKMTRGRTGTGLERRGQSHWSKSSEAVEWHGYTIGPVIDSRPAG